MPEASSHQKNAHSEAEKRSDLTKTLDLNFEDPPALKKKFSKEFICFILKIHFCDPLFITFYFFVKSHYKRYPTKSNRTK